MSLAMIHLAPGLLTLFMLVLALSPLALAWQDSRRRAQGSERLRALRQEARIAAMLRPLNAPPALGRGRPARG